MKIYILYFGKNINNSLEIIKMVFLFSLSLLSLGALKRLWFCCFCVLTSVIHQNQCAARHRLDLKRGSGLNLK